MDGGELVAEPEEGGVGVDAGVPEEVDVEQVDLAQPLRSRHARAYDEGMLHGVQAVADQLSLRSGARRPNDGAMNKSAIAIAIPLVFAACSDDNGDLTEDSRGVVHSYHVDVWEGGHLDHVASYLGPSFVSHAMPTTLPPGAVVGPDFLAQFWVGFPDLTSHEEALIADQDLVTIRWTITGTHTGTFFGVAPTGNAISVGGMDVLRVEDGKIVEQWGGVADQMDDFLAQIDAL